MDDRVLPVEHQGEHGASVSTSPCALALEFTTERWASAFRAVDMARRVGGFLTERQWVEAFNEDNLDNPIVPCPSIGFHPPAEGERSTVFVLFEDTRPHMMFKKSVFFLPAALPLVLNCLFRMFHRTLLSLNPPPRTPGPTAVGVKQMDTGDFQVSLAVSSWRLGAGALWGTCESRHGQGTHGNGVPGLNSCRPLRLSASRIELFLELQPRIRELTRSRSVSKEKEHEIGQYIEKHT